MWKDVIQLTGTFLAVVLVLFLSWYLTRKLGRYTGQFGRSNGNLQIIDRISLGQNEALALVRAGDRFLLIGISHAGISCLCELDKGTVSNLQETAADASGTDFKELLQQLTKGKKRNG